MDLNNLKNKKIAVLGLGIENYALVKFLLAKNIKCEITVCDFRSSEQLGDKYTELNRLVETRLIASLRWQLGKTYNKNLEQFDTLFRSPGWPTSCPGIRYALKVSKNKIILSSPMRLFFELSPSKNIIGVTGTKGKGTTSSLIYEIMKAAGKRVWLGGNIGVAPFDFFNKVKPSDWIVLELSSFQLEDFKVSPHIAVITNFYPEHLSPADPNNPNFHPTLRHYRESKLNIIKYQKKGDLAVINKHHSSIIKHQILKGKTIYFGKSDLASSLPGEHNKENIAAAVEAAKFIKIKDEIIERAVAKFKGLEHRLELSREVNGVKYYNDSFATTPESTITAIKSFAGPIVLLAGGAEKKSNFKQLAKQIKRKVKFVILLDGVTTPRIKRELLNIGYPNNKMKLVNNIKTAVETASDKALAGDVVLLSTACASFGMFKNYKERGKLFKAEVNKLK